MRTVVWPATPARRAGQAVGCAWPSGPGARRGGGHDGAVPCRVVHEAFDSGPVRGRHEQARAVDPAQHARERAAVELHPIQNLAALGDPHAASVTDVGVPDGSVPIEAYPVG